MFRPSHSLTVSNVKLSLEAGLRAIAGGETKIDLGDVVKVDSAAVATLLAWQRAALNRGSVLLFSNFSSSLESLIDLYGVMDLLSLITEPALIEDATLTNTNISNHRVNNESANPLADPIAMIFFLPTPESVAFPRHALDSTLF